MRKKTPPPAAEPEAPRPRYSAATIADGNGHETPWANPLGVTLHRAMVAADLDLMPSLIRGETLVIRDAEHGGRVAARRAFGSIAWTLPYHGDDAADEAAAPVVRGVRAE